MSKNEHISNSVIRRLPRYYRFLGELLSEGTTKISSRELSQRMKLTASQIRQDLNCFGGFGQQGYGYNVSELREEIERIIGLKNSLPTILIGAGNLGNALTLHHDMDKSGCELIGIFDNNPQLENREIAGLKVMMVDKLDDFCKKNSPRVAILCIPKESAKEICAKLISLGVKSFWNFSHYDINFDFDGIIVENVHLGDSLLTLAYNTNNSDL